MKRKTKISNVVIFLIFLLIIVLCQLLNYLAIRYFRFDINSRFFFGLVGDNLLAIITSILALILLTIIFIGNRKFYLPLWIIMAGTFSNQIDRLIYAGVIDYLKIGPFPSFNLADIFIISGVLYLSLSLFRTSQ